LPEIWKKRPVGRSSLTGAPAISNVSWTSPGVVLICTRRVPVKSTFGTFSAIVPPKSPAIPSLRISSVPEALLTVSTPPPSAMVMLASASRVTFVSVAGSEMPSAPKDVICSKAKSPSSVWPARLSLTPVPAMRT
jgi:hypothetical protein